MCSMSDIVDLEEALQKTGPDLFKELYRVYPVADPEDYFKNGQWRNDLLKADLTLMEAHRREAGAPDPPDMDTIKFPQLPVQVTKPVGTPVGTPALVKLAAGQQQAATAAAGAAGGGSQVVEIRLIALFVAKWKLDPTSAKECLSKLTPARRRYVIQQFKATTTGMDAVEELKTFLAECEKDGKWDNVATTAASGAKATAGAMVRPAIMPKLATATVTPKPAGIVPATGLKRPITMVSPVTSAIKRPTLATATPASVKPTIIPKAVGGAATVKPPVRPAGGKLISGLLKNF